VEQWVRHSKELYDQGPAKVLRLMTKIVNMCKKSGRGAYQEFQEEKIANTAEVEKAKDRGDITQSELQKKAGFTDDLSDTYDLIKVLGRGAFGEVLEARVKVGVCVAEIPPTTETFALKVLKYKKGEHDHLSSWDDFVAFTKSEAQLQTKAKHGNIVKVFNFLEEKSKSTAYVLMERMHCDLTAVISGRGCFPEEAARDVFAQIASATAYLHSEMQMVHRDLKPDNVLLGNALPAFNPEEPFPKGMRMIVKLSDFGLSAKYSSRKVMKSFCGTPSYSAPEIIDEARHSEGYSRAVDAWSCGVILFNMLVKKLPFPAGDIPNLVKQQKLGVVFKEKNPDGSDKITVASGISDAGQDLIKRLLNPDPLKRHTMKEAEAHPWIRGESSMADLPPTAFELMSRRRSTVIDDGEFGARIGFGDGYDSDDYEPNMEDGPDADPNAHRKNRERKVSMEEQEQERLKVVRRFSELQLSEAAAEAKAKANVPQPYGAPKPPGPANLVGQSRILAGPPKPAPHPGPNLGLPDRSSYD